MKLRKLSLSLLIVLLLGFTKTFSQQDIVISYQEARNANLAKARLDSALAAGKIFNEDLRLSRDSTANFQALYLRELKRKKNWRKAAIVLGALKLTNIWLRRIGSPFVL